MKQFRKHPAYKEIFEKYARIERGDNGKDILCYPKDYNSPPVISEKFWIEKDVNGEEIICINENK